MHEGSGIAWRLVGRAICGGENVCNYAGFKPRAVSLPIPLRDSVKGNALLGGEAILDGSSGMTKRDPGAVL
jgi:hypothetical protein